MKKFIKTKAIVSLYFMLFITIQAKSQDIFISGEYEVNIGIEYTYNIETNIFYNYTSWSMLHGGTITQYHYENGIATGVSVIWDESIRVNPGNSPQLSVVIVDLNTSMDYYGNKSVREKQPIVYPEPLSVDQNYVKTTTYRVPLSIDSTYNTTNNSKKESITYIDEFGRPLQQIALKAGGNQQDIVTPYEYDEFGRQTKEYLPYAVSSSNNGAVRVKPIEEIYNFYNKSKFDNTKNPYSEKILENSPLSRITEQAAPGKDWKYIKSYFGQPNITHTIKFEYNTNKLDIQDLSKDNVKLYQVNFVNNDKKNPTLVDNDRFYEKSTLYKTTTKDENWNFIQEYIKDHTTEEFKNKQGQVILKRTYNQDIKHDTYYVYDDFGNLTYVIPPKVNTTDGISATELKELCYQYVYDNRNRLVEKQLPGKEREYIIYNNADQPILTQDANQRSAGMWLFTKYDALGRVAYTGKATSTNTTSREAIQNEVNTFTGSLWVTQGSTATNYGGVNMYYNNGAYPNGTGSLVTLSEILTVNYYDSYVDRPTGAPTSIVLMESPTNETNLTSTKGLATVSKVKVLDVTGANVWINTLTYYDAKSRPVYVYNENTYLGTVDIVENKLDFVGRVLKSKTTHTKNNVTITTLDNFTYDHVGRLKTQTQCIGDETMGYECPGGNPTDLDLNLSGTINTDHAAGNSITITNATILPNTRLWISTESQEVVVSNTYDDLGQLESKGVGGKALNNRLQTVDYAYNVRGWLKQINDPSTLGNDLFAFKIGYNEGANALYNGNISSTQWKTANTDNSLKTYNYRYDALNRITNATDNSERYNLSSISYDKNGNITNLTRTGHVVDNPVATNNAHFGTMDQLSYTYQANSNKLLKVTDAAAIDKYGFKDDAINTAADTSDDYTYDLNGNMLTDANKGISTNITYNHLNLPTQVTLGGGNISYIYDATGTKLKKVVSTGATTEYAANFVYESGSLKFFNHPEGYVDVNGSSYSYVYQYKDHLGNVRLSYKDSDNDGVAETSEILEENNYYPFGLRHKGYNNNPVTNHPYKYNGKELNEELGLNWYDFGARNYDASLGRWMNLDPLAEKYYEWSPYNYVKNSPITLVDPDGLDVILFIWLTSEGNFGHSGVAVSNYKKDDDGNYITDEDGNYIEDGTYTYYDLFPKDGITEKNAFDPQSPDFNLGNEIQGSIRTVEDLQELIQSDGMDSQADGILLTETDFKTDKVIKERLEDIKNSEYTLYDSANMNCSTFCREAYEGMIQAKEQSSPGLNNLPFLPKKFGKESDSYDGKNYTFSTPHALFRSVRALKSTYVIKDPGKAVNKGFKEALGAGGSKKSRKKN
ncbi:DUF6443 domain-containing protein [Flavivirga eckloniae]|uniref:DUF6443 domain-containing protein n=1 Tax=Flavivirga eckloniae TaxID=1803846 RepID=A0A2K9PSR3_9FLAO|nr:DUF6443 domain-containing protein [Flavivirga eckloniae]AUP80095.1 hypothetical protein C1H87_15825 [Flavivirga eckloniae]